MSNKKEKKEKRSRRVKTRRRIKKRNGGASASSPPKSKRTKAEQLELLLGRPNGPYSGMFELLTHRLLDAAPPPHPPHRVASKMLVTLTDRVKTKMTKTELFKLFKMAEFKMAQDLHATSFSYHRDSIIANIAKKDVLQRCIDANVAAIGLLNVATEAENLEACAYLADMLLSGNTVGVEKDGRRAFRLVHQVDHPDCKGVLARSYFDSGVKAGRQLAKDSAASDSKYGQYVVGLYAQQDGNMAEAVKYFTLAAEQNYDEAQIALSKTLGNVPPETEALRLLNLAADQGNRDAFYLIGEIYHRESNDNPRTHAFRVAMAWHKLAENAKHPYSLDKLSQMQRNLDRS
jgi:TPR repeat protein